jgi:hypothetical protein
MAPRDKVSAGSDHGRESALVTQLAANASLWLREMGKPAALWD